MKRAYSFAEIRAAEARAIAAGETVGSLTERAGLALADAAEEAMERLGVPEALFVCGGGNNGGDGFAAARILLGRKRAAAVLCLAETFSEACAEQKRAFKGEILGRPPRRRYPLMVDCVLGTGVSRPPEGNAAVLIDFLRGADYVIACDLPSGLKEGGIAYSPCVKADETVCMGGLKQALLLADGADLAGQIAVADLGLPLEGGAEVWEEGDVSALFPKRKSHSNKGDYGSVAILATCNILGAPLLAAGAALKSGAGYTDLYMTSSSVPCGDAASLAAFRTADELHRVLCAAKYPACRFSFYDGEPLFTEAVAFGMGAGTGETAHTVLEELLSTYRYGTLVLDADALNTLAMYGTERLKERKCPVVITPHIKEFARLTGKTAEEILSDPFSCAKAFSEEYGVTVVLKNNRTVIAEGERVAVNTAGSPALAKGGSGDALAGLLAGTCARGVPPFEAAVAACYVLGKAGEIAAEKMGEYAPDASDVIALLPEAMARLPR